MRDAISLGSLVFQLNSLMEYITIVALNAVQEISLQQQVKYRIMRRRNWRSTPSTIAPSNSLVASMLKLSVFSRLLTLSMMLSVPLGLVVQNFSCFVLDEAIILSLSELLTMIFVMRCCENIISIRQCTARWTLDVPRRHFFDTCHISKFTLWLTLGQFNTAHKFHWF